MALLAEYPKNVTTAFASFLEIERLQYKKGLEKAGGATETLLTSGLAGVLGGIGGGIASLYNIGAKIQSTISQLESTSRTITRDITYLSCRSVWWTGSQ